MKWFCRNCKTETQPLPQQLPAAGSLLDGVEWKEMP